MRILQLSVDVKESLVESQRISYVVFVSFHRCFLNVVFIFHVFFHYAFLPSHVEVSFL